MATIVFSSFVIRYPVGGVLSNNLQFLTGFARLGHDVYLFEKAGYDDSCFDPDRRVSSNDCRAGVDRIARLLGAHGLAGSWAYVAADGSRHGLTAAQTEDVIARADLFIDRGMHRTWDDETADVPVRVLIDPDPGFRQVRMANSTSAAQRGEGFDAYFTYGHNIGTPASPAPDVGLDWHHVFHPVDTTLYEPSAPPTGAAVTTVMNWSPLETVSFEGREFGMKDIQFPRFEQLPELVDTPMQLAVDGHGIPQDRLRSRGWQLVDAIAETSSYESYHRYLRSSLAEFSVVKDVYHGLNVGWFSDRSAAYLAHGRPVVVQENGIAEHLPTGEGLFEVADADEAARAIFEITRDPERHCAAARRIAEEHLDTDRVLGDLLRVLDIPTDTEKRTS